MRRLDRYIGRTVIGGSLVALLVVVALSVVFEFIDETGDLTGRYTTLKALLYVLLTMPYRAYESFPIATLIGSLVGLGGLAARHELVVMRAAGVSVLGIARAVIGAGLILALVAMVLGEWLAPRAQELAHSLRAQALSEYVAAGDGGYWVRDGERYIAVERVPAPRLIEGVRVYRFDGQRLASVIQAARGLYRDGAWQLQRAVVTRFEGPGVTVSRLGERRLEVGLRPQMLELVVMKPETLPLPDLYRYIRYLERNNLESDRYRLAFWIKLATPLATVAMLVLTVPLVFGSQRSTGAGQRIFVGVLIGIAFFLANRLLNHAGLIYGLPPALSALAPTAVFLLVGLVGLVRVR